MNQSRKIYHIMSFIVVFLLLMLMSRAMANQIYIFLGENTFGVFSNSLSNLLLFILIMGATLYQLAYCKHHQKKVKYNKKSLFFVVLFLIIISVSVLVNDTEFSLVRSLWILFSTYLIFVLFLLVSSFEFNIFSSKIIFKVTLFFTIVQLILGVIQYIKKDPIFSVYSQGENILNPVFFLNGASSANEYFLDLGAKVRAFGLTDSGLTLGMFSLLMLSYTLFKKMKPWLKLFSILFCLLVIYMTITRIIYLTAILMIIYYILMKKNKYTAVKKIYLGTLVAQIIYPTILQWSVLAFINRMSIESLETIKSRIEGTSYFIINSKLDFLTIIFGTNITSNLKSFDTPYSIDNEFLKVFLDIGILGYTILMFTFTFYLFRYLSRMEKEQSLVDGIFICFLLTFPFVGILNVVNYFYIPVFLIYILIKKGESKGPVNFNSI